MRRRVLRTRAVMTGLLLSGAVLLLWPGMSLAAAPTLGPDCGAGASIVGSDSAGKVTLGTGASNTSTCTLTFASPWANAPACTAVNETNSGGFTTPVGTKSTTTTLMIGGALPWSDRDVISYLCVGY